MNTLVENLPPLADANSAPDASQRATVAGIEFSLAQPADDPDICAFLAGLTMPGPIRLEVRTDPSFFAAARLLGAAPEVLLARAADTRAIVGLGVRTWRRLLANRLERRVGHLSFLRVAPCCRHRRDFLRAGFDLLHRLHKRDPADFYLTAILRENLPARRLLEAHIKGFPVYQPLTDVSTFTLGVADRRLTPARDADACAALTPADAGLLRECLERSHQSLELTPVRAANAFNDPSEPGPRITDFVAVRGTGQFRAAAALWDQRPLRQTVIAGYSRKLRLLRPAANLLQALRGRPTLPAPGPLRLACISCLAVDDHDPACALQLLRHLAATARRRGIAYLALSLAARHSLCPTLAPLAVHRTESVLYLVRWPEDPAPALSHRIPYVEAGLL